jgi:hypothetical protein
MSNASVLSTRECYEVLLGAKETPMSSTGLDVFDKTLQTTHIWLDELMQVIGPDRQVAWHVLGSVLRTLRDRVPLGLAVHLGWQLPLLVRGTYYDQWHAPDQTLEQLPRSLDEFLQIVSKDLANIGRSTCAMRQWQYSRSFGGMWIEVKLRRCGMPCRSSCEISGKTVLKHPMCGLDPSNTATMEQTRRALALGCSPSGAKQDVLRRLDKAKS